MIRLLENKRVKERLNYKMKVCAMASEIALIHGIHNCTEQLIRQSWNHVEYEPSLIIWQYITIKNIRWYIKNFVEIQDQVWNADFIMGLTQYGKLKNGKSGFYTFYWFNNESIEEILDNAPFFGKKSYAWKRKANRLTGHYMWRTVPALSLKYSDKSLSFMAGVLATGRISQKAKRRKHDKDNDIFVRYNLKIEPLLKQWHIPIEKRDVQGVYISPFWVALLTPWMPPCCQKWAKFRTAIAYKAKDYALIMWKIYTNKDIRRKGIPYLISRRSYYENYGSIKGLERRWVEEKLVEVDSRIKDAVIYWGKNIREDDEDEK